MGDEPELSASHRRAEDEAGRRPGEDGRPAGPSDGPHRVAVGRRWRRILTVVGVGSLALAVVVVVAVFYFNQVEQQREDTRASLAEIARLKANEVGLWVRERDADAQVVSSDVLLAQAVGVWLVEGQPEVFDRDVRPYLESVLRDYRYYAIAVLDVDGETRYSVSNRDIADADRLPALLRRAEHENAVVFSGLYLGEDGAPYMDWVVPLFDVETPDRLVGGVLLRSDPALYLYPLLATWPGRSPTAETLLVRRDGDEVVFLNPLRFRADSALTFRLSMETERLLAAEVVQGRRGAGEGIDYRGHEVLAAYRPIPDTDWGIVAKVDTDDVYASVRREAWLAVLLVAALLVTGSLVLIVLWRRRDLQVARAEARAATDRAALARHYELLSRHANDSMLLLDERGEIIECNERAEEMYRSSRDELLGRAFSDLRLRDDASPSSADRLQGLAPGGSLVLDDVHRRPDGSTIETESSVRAVEVEGRRYYQAIVRDVSERAAAERALQERERMLSTLLGNLPGAAYRCENREPWGMQFISDGCRELTGYEPSQLVGDGEVVFGSLIHPDDLPMVRREVTRVLGRDEPFTITYRIRCADGSEKWVWDRGRPVVLEGEERSRFHEGFLTDITDRVRTEQALGESEARYRALAGELERHVDERTAELRSANRELEAFSYSVSHDLRAPLRAIDGFSLALVEDFGDELPEDGRGYLARVRAASQRMGELIDDLLSLSRVTRADMAYAEVDLSSLAESVGEEIRERRPDIPVELRVARGLTVLGDEHLLRILLENLLDNAWKFSAGATEPRVEVGVVDGEGGAAFYVRDNGVGFDLGFAERLFSPFQRFHSPGDFEGTGVGLAIVQRIVRRHGGWIWVESTPGAGATFFFTLGGESDTLAPEES